MRRFYGRTRRVLAVAFPTCLICLALIGPLPETQLGAIVTSITTGMASLLLAAVAAENSPRSQHRSLQQHFPSRTRVHRCGDERGGLP